MLKKILRYSIPPIFVVLYQKLRAFDVSPNSLFDGDDRLFKKVLKNSKVYGEYGCGKSTKWVLNNTESRVIAVDTSKQWVEEVLSDNAENNQRLLVKHADVGQVGDWGMPVDFSKREMFHVYADFLWNQDEKPNVVLVDGRFRVCCFLTSLRHADEGTHILFDDYTTRPHYHVVEKYVDRAEECGRQCLFVVPPSKEMDLDNLERDIDKFRYVMD